MGTPAADERRFECKNRIAAINWRRYGKAVKRTTENGCRSEASRQPGTLPQNRFWQAVVARDGRYDGVFIYAVRSTGVYCRPSCPSRRPRRGRVVFFSTPSAAEAEGFRPCQRCHPRDLPQEVESRLIVRACRLMECDSCGPVRVASVARQMGLTPFRLQRIFRRLVGITPGAYAQSVRFRRLKKQLREDNDVTTALYEAGYGSSSRLYEHSNDRLGMTPAAYRRGGQGMEIHYTTASSDLGRVLLAGTTKGVSAVYLGNSDRELEAALHREYPGAQIHKNSGPVAHWLRELLRHISGHQPALELPIDVRATAFQCRVWGALRRIPPGATRTYSDLARIIGLPRGQRAVARACATNPVSILIPCHRVVREDGGLGGYRWGLGRKRALLAREKKTDH